MAINNFNAKNGLSVGSNPINIVDNTANATFATAMTTGSMGVGTSVVATSRLFISGTSTSSDTTLVVRAGVPSPSGRLLDIRNNSGTSVASIDYLGNIFGVSGSFSGDITITGNLTVAGTQTIVNSEIVNIKDNIVLLNANPSPAATGGIYVADTVANTTGSLIWDSAVDQWKAGKSGSEITLVSGSGTNNYVTKWNGSNSVGDSIVFDNGTNVGIGTSLLDSKLVVAGNVVISGSVNPSDDNNATYVLGSSAKRWSNVVATALSGSLTKLSDGTTNYLQAGSNIAITTGSNGSVTIATTGLASTAVQYLTLAADASLSSERVFTPSTGLKFTDGGAGGNYTLSINDNIVATVSGTTFTGVTNHTAGLSGSLTKLTDGTSYLIAGTGISIATGSNGSVNISSPNAATISLPYLTVGNDSTLTNERSLTAGNGILSVDGGANGAFTLSINDSIVATVSGTTFTGVTKHNAGLSGSLTRLTDGSSYIVAGGNMTVLTGSSGAITLATVNSGTIHGVTAGNGLLGGGTSNVVSLEINDSIVATVSGTTFTGATKHNAGLSGSLTKLTDGTSYLIAGNNIQITTGSTGAVTVANTATGATYIAGTNTQVQFNDGGTFGADGDFTFDKNNNLLRVTNISGSLTSSNVVAGQVVLAGTGGVLSGSNNFWWDNSTGNVGIGTSNSNGNRLAISGGNLSVTGSVLPGASTTYDLGSTTYRWRDLYARTGSFSGDVTITGDLIVNGTQFIVNTQVVEIEDNAILLNAGPSPASSGGIYVADTTTGITGSLLWDSTTDLWKAGKLGSEVSLVSGSGTNNYLTKWVGSNAVGTSIVIDDGTNVGVGMMPTTDKLSVNGSVSVTGSLLPGVDNTYDLGSSTKRWKLIQAVNISGSLTGSNVLAGQVIVAGTGGVLSGSNNFTYNNSDLTISGTLRSVYSVGDEGGELFFTKPQTNTTLNDGVTIDLHRNRIRIFEAGGTNRGGYFDVSTLAAGASTNLVPLPAGSDTQVQFNDGGTFGADGDFTFDKANNLLQVTNISGSLTGSNLLAGHVVVAGNGGLISGSNNFWWDNAAARVGIGTSSFTARLHVSGSSTSANPTTTLRAGVSLPSAGILDVQTSTGTSIFDIYETVVETTIPIRGGNGSATAPTFSFTGGATTGMYRRTSGQLLSFAVSGNQAFGVDTNGNFGINVAATSAPSGRLHVQGDSGSGSTNTLLVRHGAANGANLPVLDVQNSVNTSLLFVSGSGNVGIGTNNPAKRLHVVSNQPLRMGTVSEYWEFLQNNTNEWAFISNASVYSIFMNNTTGNVGIGTNTTTDKFAVNGVMSVTGSLLPGVDDTYDLGSSTKRWANVHADNVTASGSLGPAYTSPSSTSGTTALFDTVSISTDAAVYELMIIGNPNSSASMAYRDVIYGKVIIGTGNNGAAVRNYIQFIAESPAPRSLYGAAGNGPLTADVVYLQAGNEFTDIAQGGTATLRVKIAGYAAGFVGNNTTVRLKQLA